MARIGRFFSSYDQKGLATIQPKTRLLAWFAKQTYNRNPPKEYKSFTRIVNNPTVKAYKSDRDKTIIIAVRGTQVTDNYDDIDADIQVALGSEEQTKRFAMADNIVATMLRRFPDYKIMLTGHSLGGGIVYRLADKYKQLTGEVFNPAVNIKTIRDTAGTSSRVRTHIIHGDPVSGIVGRPLANTQVYSPAYGEERKKIEAMHPILRLQYLHALDRFPRG